MLRKGLVLKSGIRFANISLIRQSMMFVGFVVPSGIFVLQTNIYLDHVEV